MHYQQIKITIVGLLSMMIIITSCTPSKKEVLLANFQEMYQHILNQNFNEIENYLDGESSKFYTEITDQENLNIDSIIVLGERYNLRYMLIEYLALNGDAIKKSGEKTDFFRYLGSEDVSFFSYSKGFYTEKTKTKIGKENFVSLLRDDMTRTKRTWAQFVEPTEGTYKLDLLYTLRIHEATDQKILKQLQKDHPDKSIEECLRYLYWQLSGDNSEEYNKQQKELELKQIQGRSVQIESYKSKIEVK